MEKDQVQTTDTLSDDDRSGRPKGDDSFRLEDFTPYRLSVLTDRISRELARIYQDKFDLSIAEWRVLANLGSFEPLSAQQVAEYSSMDKAKVSRAIARLQRNELLIREKDPNDNRAAILRLSKYGRRIYGEIAPLAADWEKDLLTVLSAEQVDQLSEIITLLHQQLDLR